MINQLTEIDFCPPVPKNKAQGIGLVACGAITEYHLTGYKNGEYEVKAFYDPVRESAEEKRNKFYPEADVCSSLEALLERDDIAVVDIATHTEFRPALIEKALEYGKHVLSQKPFVHNLDQGKDLADMADDKGLKLAVNQNGRWAPHWRYLTQILDQGILGGISTFLFNCEWHHDHVHKKDFFNRMKHVILYDYSIHWFDILTRFMGDEEPLLVCAQTCHASTQKSKPPLLAQCQVKYETALANYLFSAFKKGPTHEETRICGEKGSVVSTGPSINDQQVRVNLLEKGDYQPELKGKWFPEGFQGSMGELLCAIEEDREPENSARKNLKSLALTFAAMESAETNRPVVPGDVKTISIYR